MSSIKEVIRVLGFIQEYFDNHADEQEPNKRKELFVDWSDTVLEAIAMLKAQEPNEDWISRKRLKDEIQYYIDEAGWGDEANKVLGWCMEFIDNQRAVKWE